MTDAEPTVVAPTLDTSGESWVGTFPGLGRVVVDARGGYVVELDVSHAGDDAAHDALEYGWAEALSFARRGFRLAGATTMVPGPRRDSPGDAPTGAVMISGARQAVAEVAIELAGHDWRMVADTVTPIRTTPTLVAHPRRSPWIAPRHLSVDSPLVDGERLRPGTTAQLVSGARHDRPVAVLARLAVIDRPARGRAVLETVRGRDRMGAEFQVLGTLQAGARIPAPQLMQEDLVLASLPTARLFWAGLPAGEAGVDPSGISAVIQWWTDATA